MEEELESIRNSMNKNRDEKMTDQEVIKTYIEHCIYSDLRLDCAFEDMCNECLSDELIINQLIKDGVIAEEDVNEWLTEKSFPSSFNYNIMKYLHEIPFS